MEADRKHLCSIPSPADSNQSIGIYDQLKAHICDQLKAHIYDQLKAHIYTHCHKLHCALCLSKCITLGMTSAALMVHE